MFHEKTKEKVKELINLELENAKKQYGEKFNSDHEFMSVLGEEYNEVVEYMEWIGKNLVALQREALYEHLSLMEHQHYNGTRTLDSMLQDVNEAVKELAQVGAVIKKYKGE